MNDLAFPQEAIRIQDLSMVFGKSTKKITALDRLNAIFPAGVLSALVGPDGAGKSTLLRILSGLMLPTQGEALIFGNASKTQDGQIAYMPQRFGLYEDLTVEENLRLQARLRALDEKTGESRAAKLLSFTGLQPFLKRLAGKLSGGMKQKLGIACALMGKPSLLLLDEPGVGVDPASRRELWSMVQHLKAEGMTILWATSYMDEAQKFPYILLLDRGRALFQGSPATLMSRMKGRVFLLPTKQNYPDEGRAKRDAFLKWSSQAGVADALIQASSLRIALAKEVPAALYADIEKAHGRPCEASLEDVYMSLLGGINHEQSPYIALFSGKKVNMGSSTEDNIKIKAQGLGKKFGSFTAVHALNLAVKAGEIFGLLGPNGAGKTTTFQMLCGLLRPSFGTCFVAGVNLLHAGSAARMRLGYMAQKFSLYPDIKVKDNILCWGKLYGMTKQAIAKSIEELAAALSLSAWLNAKTASLPLGLKQRLSLFCATMHNPAVLFLDEPTSGVDVRARRDFWKHISALANLGTAVLVTTHFMEEAEYCDRIALMYRGAIIQEGSPDHIKKAVSGVQTTLEEAFIENIEKYDKAHPL